jgi:hypothetical protein
MEENCCQEPESYSVKKSPPFMEPEVLFPCSQESATKPYSQPNKFSTHFLPYFFKTNFNIILPPMLRTYKYSYDSVF